MKIRLFLFALAFSPGLTVAAAAKIKTIFVIVMENTDADSAAPHVPFIYGNTTSAPYINGELIPDYAIASNFTDELPLPIPSEPHYVWMEAGTNVFPDRTFVDDAPPSAKNSTRSTAHLVTQLRHAKHPIGWMSYQEGLDAVSGACPVDASPAGFYQPKHNPFVFFQDVAGHPPSQTNAYCAAHHKPYRDLAGDLAANKGAPYNYLTPNLCHDMHGAAGCPDPDNVQAGDAWLKANLPPLIAYCHAHEGVIFITWDEGAVTAKLPFLVIGAHVKKGYVSKVRYDHGSLLKSVERILGVPVLPRVSQARDFSDFFEPGYFP